MRSSPPPTQRPPRSASPERGVISDVRPEIQYRGGMSMTLIWFVIWLIANNIGDHEALAFDPVNVWTATLILAVALDINRPQVLPRRNR
jgi:hypothetical protein